MDDKNNNENLEFKNIITASTFFGSSDSYFDN